MPKASFTDAPVLTPDAIDEVELWAQAALEDDPDDTLAQTSLALVQENKELRMFLHRDADGQLAILQKIQLENERLERKLTDQEDIIGRRSRELREKNTELTSLKRRLERYTTILHKVEVLLHIARTRMAEDGSIQDGGPEEVGRLLGLVEKEYDEMTERHQRQG